MSALLTQVKNGALSEHIDSIFKIVHTGNFNASTQALSILFHFAAIAEGKLGVPGGGDRSGGKGRGKGRGAKGDRGGDPSAAASGGEGGARGDDEGASKGAGKGEGKAASLTDRFYRALYAKLGGPQLADSAKPTLFLNLLFKVKPRLKKRP